MFCVDEQIVPFKGYSGLKCYNPKKPHKWGYKMFALCDTIVYNFDIYQGKIIPKPYHRDIGPSSNIVLQLASILPDNKNFLLFFDNWFASPLLLVELQKRGIGSLGTIRLNRFPGCSFNSDNQMKKKGRGTYEEKEAVIEGISIRAIKWFDNRGVTLATSFSSTEPISITERWDRKQKKKISIEKPYAVDIYNKFMGGVDLLDGQIAYYRITVRSKKYYMGFFYHFIDIMTVNAWNLYKIDCENVGLSKKDVEDQLTFKASVANSLCLNKKNLARKRGRSSNSGDSIGHQYAIKKKRGPTAQIPSCDIRRDQTGHWPIVTEQRLHCKLSTCTHLSFVKCIKCNVHLCLRKEKNCFVGFHN